MLSFGEFSPEHQYKGETFTIHWGDGTKDVVKFDLYITWKKQNPTIHKRLYLNDKEYSKDSFLIKIVK
ncbi:putative lipoprotein [Bacteroides fragilis str. 3998 T(B) 4]|nr:putative lipoprotein [Bacteroides fragilis str. 3998 T(B) 4]